MISIIPMKRLMFREWVGLPNDPLAFLPFRVWPTPNHTNNLDRNHLLQTAFPTPHPTPGWVRGSSLRVHSSWASLSELEPRSHTGLCALEGDDVSGLSPSILRKHRKTSTDGYWEEVTMIIKVGNSLLPLRMRTRQVKKGLDLPTEHVSGGLRAPSSEVRLLSFHWVPCLQSWTPSHCQRGSFLSPLALGWPDPQSSQV